LRPFPGPIGCSCGGRRILRGVVPPGEATEKELTPRERTNDMKYILGSIFAAVLIAPLAISSQQDKGRGLAPVEVSKCEEGECKKCKKKCKDREESLLAKCGGCEDKDKDKDKDKEKEKEGESVLVADSCGGCKGKGKDKDEESESVLVADSCGGCKGKDKGKDKDDEDALLAGCGKCKDKGKDKDEDDDHEHEEGELLVA
jgi:hypothetical protein